MSRPSAIERAGQWLDRSGVLPPFVAIVQLAATYVLLAGAASPALLLLAFSGCYAVYHLDRAVLVSPEDVHNRPAELAGSAAIALLVAAGTADGGRQAFWVLEAAGGLIAAAGSLLGTRCAWARRRWVLDAVLAWPTVTIGAALLFVG